MLVKYTIDEWDEERPDKRAILTLIQKHAAQAERMRTLESYYEGHHKIEDRQRTKGAPNNKVSANFARYITDVTTGYFMSTPITYADTAGGDIEPLLMAFDVAHVDDVDADNAFEASINGEAYEYIYAAEGETELRCKNLCAQNCFMIYDTSIEERELAGVYYRTAIDDTTGRIRYIATVATEHYIYTYNYMTGSDLPDTEACVPHYFGAVPLIRYQNNHETIGDFEQVISLIDAYDAVFSDRVNNVQDFVDAILIIYGTLLSDDSESGNAKQALKEGKLLEFPDKQTMGAEYLIHQLDQSGVEVAQDAISRDILRMSYVPDFTDENFAQNASGVAIAYKCLLLEWLTKTKERFYRIGLRKRVHLFCNYMGLRGLAMNADSVVPHFARSLPVNQIEIAQMIAMLADHVSERTLLQQLPFVEDPDFELDALKEEREQAAQRDAARWNIRPNTPPPPTPDDEPEDDDEDGDDA